MKIILVDRLNYPFGGTQKYVFSLAQILLNNQNDVYLFDGQNITQNFNSSSFSFTSPKFSFLTKIQSIYSFSIFFKSLFLFKKIKPDIIHLHNINYTITPSIITAAKFLKIPVVAHLHDYKLVCPKATLLDNSGKSCRDCQNQHFFSVLKNHCSHHPSSSFFESLFLFFENQIHFKLLRVYQKVDCFIAPSFFLKKTFLKMGFPYPIKVIPNFSSLKNPSASKLSKPKNKIIYFGRLAPEKGLIQLCHAIQNSNFYLTIVGDGPLSSRLKKISAKQKNIKLLHFQKEDKLINLIKKHDYSIVPSVWPENASIAIIESLALGKPIITTNIGGSPEMVKNNFTGWTFSPTNFSQLSFLFKELSQIDPQKYNQISNNCLKIHQTKFSPKIHYQLITNLYKKYTF